MLLLADDLRASERGLLVPPPPLLLEVEDALVVASMAPSPFLLHDVSRRCLGKGTSSQAQEALPKEVSLGPVCVWIWSFGEFVTGSAYESVRALRKAAAYQHPRALIVLAQHLLEGMGCSVDVAEALSCFRRCAVVDPSYEATAQELLFSYAGDSVQNGDIRIAVDICSQLAAACNVKAQYFVAAYGMLLDHGGARDFMYRWLVMASINNSDLAKLGPAEVALRLGKVPQARLFFRRYRLLDGSNVIESTMGTVDASTCVELLRQTFRDVRRNCGYCGISLDRMTRKLCKGCETVAFCSRDCQKMDWNGKDGHRNDCKDAMALRAECVGRLCPFVLRDNLVVNVL